VKKFLIVAIALTLSAPLALTSRAQDSAKPKMSKPHVQKINGWVSDEKCGAKGASASHIDCAKKCVEDGSAIIFIGDKGKMVYKVDNQDVLKEHVGHYVKVTGTVTDGALHVDKVAMLKQPKAPKQKGEHGA